METMQARETDTTVFNAERKDLSQQNPMCGKNTLQDEGEEETVSDEEKLREFVASTPALQGLLKELLQTEEK